MKTERKTIDISADSCGANWNSHLRVSTLVDIAITIERDLGITQKCTVEEMWKNLVDAAGHCRTRKEAAAAISKYVYNQ